MASSEMDIESLLADILDDDKPLPTKPTVAQVVVNTQLNATGNKAGAVAMDNPEDFLESLMNEEPAAPTPMDVAQAAEVGAEMALSEAMEPDIQHERRGPPVEVTQRVTERDEIAEAMESHGLAPKQIKTYTLKEVVQNIKEKLEVEQVFDEADEAVAALFGDTPSAKQPAQTNGPMTEAVHGGVFADSPDREEGAAVTSLKMPTFTAADFASTMDIRNFATLVTLNTARWHAKVKDRQASKDAALVSEAEEGAFETRKHLLGGANAALKAIHKAIDEARAAHYEMTLPWTTTSMQDIGRRTGGRLLPNTLFVEYTTVMATKKQQMLDALAKFEPEYPTLIEAAKKKLGKRFDFREYPNVSSIRTHFDLSFDFEPIPKGDDFKGLPQVQLDALARKINDNTQKQAENAMQEVWKRLHEAVSRMAERLSSPDKLFHDSLVQNVRDVARLLAHLNVTQDAKVEALRKKVDKHLCQHEPKVLRSNQIVRAQVGAHAVSIIQEMDK
jgi:hypothetical protein